MATYSKQILSGSTSGRPIEVVATSSPGTTIHTVVASATADKEAHHLYAINSATTDRILSLEFGGTSTIDLLEMLITAQDGPILVSPGWPLTGTDQITRAFATATGGLAMGGFANRIVA